MLFKVASKFGKYYLYHAKTMGEFKAEDAQQMVWLVLRSARDKDPVLGIGT